MAKKAQILILFLLSLSLVTNCSSSPAEISDEEIDMKASEEAKKWKEGKEDETDLKKTEEDKVKKLTATPSAKTSKDGFDIETTEGSKYIDPKKPYKLYSNSSYKYSVILPAYWSMTKTDIDGINYVRVQFNNNVIRIKSYNFGKGPFSDEITKAKDKILTTDPFAKELISDRELTIAGGKKGTLFVYEYRNKKSHKTHILRTLAIETKDIAHFITCDAPRDKFYYYEEIFNISMTSFAY